MSFFRRHAELWFFAVVLALLVTFFSALSSHFWSVSTFQTIANRVPTLTLAAVGMTLVLVAGGIDLSVGSVAAVAGATFGWCAVDAGWPLGFGLAAALGVGGLCGAFNGLVVNWLRMPSFIVTLGVLEVARGLAYLITDSQTKYLGNRLEFLQAPVPALGVSTAFVMAMVITVGMHFLLTRTVFGRQVVAIGTNEEASRLAGLSPRKVRAIVFVLSGGLAGLAGLCQIARLSAADPNAGAGLELSAIAAAVIGGTSLLGGRGSMLMTLGGVLIIATLESGLAHLGVTEPIKRVVTGLVIIAAVGAEATRLRLVRRRRTVKS